MMRMLIAGLCFVFALNAAAFEQGRVRLKSGATEHIFNVEIADDNAERARGLMYRAYLDDGAGMLFIWPDSRPKPQKFWMHNTLLPLDIMFFDKKGRLIQIDTRQPLDENAMGPDESVKMVLEIMAGEAERLKISPDQKWKLQVLPASPEPADHVSTQD